MSQTPFTFCTAVDGTVRLHAELVLWAVCATRSLPLDKFRLVAYLIDHQDKDLQRWLEERGVEVRLRKAPAPGIPHCNRLAGFLEKQDSECIIATDTDLFFVRDPSALFANTSLIRAAPNNACNPPAFIFKRLLEESRLGKAYRPTLALMPGIAGMQETHINNISAGIAALPASISASFAESWRKWALWLAARSQLLDQWVGHIDQAAFALACEEIGSDVVFLPPQTNLVLPLLDKVETVYAFHLSSGHIPEFPKRFRRDKTMTTEDLSPDVVRAVENLNACILEATRALAQIPRLRGSMQTLLNPSWTRP